MDAFNNQTFNQDGNESAILKLKYYSPPNLNFQHLPVKEKVRKIEVNRKINGYFIDTLTSNDIHEIVKKGGNIIETNEGVFYRENFKISPFRKVIEKIIASRKSYKDEHNDLLIFLLMNSLYSVQIRREIDQSCKCKSQHWMERVQ